MARQLRDAKITLVQATQLSQAVRAHAGDAQDRPTPAASLHAYAVEVQRRARRVFGAPLPPLLDGAVTLAFELRLAVETYIHLVGRALDLEQGS